jgi:hypothetical protein
MPLHIGSCDYEYNDKVHIIQILINTNCLVLIAATDQDDQDQNIILILWKDFFTNNEIKINGQIIKLKQSECDFNLLCKRLIELPPRMKNKN